MTTIHLTNAAFNNERELIKKITHELSEVVGMTLVGVSYNVDGLGMKFEKAPRRASPDTDPYHTSKEFRGEHENGHCWCGGYHEAIITPPKPVGPPLKDMREGDIPKMPEHLVPETPHDHVERAPLERPARRRAPDHDSMGPEK